MSTLNLKDFNTHGCFLSPYKFLLFFYYISYFSFHATLVFHVNILATLPISIAVVYSDKMDKSDSCLGEVRVKEVFLLFWFFFFSG